MNLCDLYVCRHDSLKSGTVAIAAIQQVFGCSLDSALATVVNGSIVCRNLEQSVAENKLSDLRVAWGKYCLRFNCSLTSNFPFYLAFQDEV